MDLEKLSRLITALDRVDGFRVKIDVSVFDVDPGDVPLALFMVRGIYSEFSVHEWTSQDSPEIGGVNLYLNDKVEVHLYYR